jgi:beta-phosphoglucomutase-like phosphatase (HAD superfamily)
VIFGSHGVLVDSEELSATTLLAMTSPFGLKLGIGDAKRCFTVEKCRHSRMIAATSGLTTP